MNDSCTKSFLFPGRGTNKKAIESLYGLLESEQSYNIHIKTIEKFVSGCYISSLNQVWSQQERRKLSLKMPGENEWEMKTEEKNIDIKIWQTLQSIENISRP